MPIRTQLTSVDSVTMNKRSDTSYISPFDSSLNAKQFWRQVNQTYRQVPDSSSIKIKKQELDENLQTILIPLFEFGKINSKIAYDNHLR